MLQLFFSTIGLLLDLGSLIAEKTEKDDLEFARKRSIERVLEENTEKTNKK